MVFFGKIIMFNLVFLVSFSGGGGGLDAMFV